jgi:predicted phage tail protein
MRELGHILIILGVIAAVGSLGLFVAVSAYVMIAKPTDVTGWGAAMGGSMIAAIGLVPLGLAMIFGGIGLVRQNPPRPY